MIWKPPTVVGEGERWDVNSSSLDFSNPLLDHGRSDIGDAVEIRVQRGVDAPCGEKLLIKEREQAQR